MKKIEISIIIPCYNCADTIEETLKSIECDSFHDYEVIIINDGSIDATEEIIKTYLKSSKLNIRVIDQENSGVSIARNRGIEESKGKYILFLDGDDLLARGSLEAVHIMMERYEVDTMSCYRTKNIKELKDIRELEGHFKVVNALKVLEEYTYSKSRLGFTSFVYKKDILDKFNIRFMPYVKYGEDWEFATKYLAHCNQAIELDYYYYYYRILYNSVSRTTSFNQVDAIKAAERTAKYLDKIKHPFAKRFREYMYNRAIFSVAHRFAKGRRSDYYKMLIKQYPVKKAMKSIRTDDCYDVRTKLAAIAFLVSPNLFYFIAKKG